MTYSFSIYPAREELLRLFRAVGWESANYPQSLSKAVSCSETVLTAWEDNRLCGLMTAVSDGAMNVFFPYLAVHPDSQGKGVGKEMVARMLQKYGDVYRKILVCNEDKTAFYEKCGLRYEPDQRPMFLVDSYFAAQ
ncbi:MAG: GNAT family N-acetyltransferase [Ruminococcus sp.]|nr:GNAT family N-acetyltransferase [Ruminococcus sp.]